jgi:glycosyltransferase involved in cell wall biosynthesis
MPSAPVLLHLAEFSPHSPGHFVQHLEHLGLRARERGWSCVLALPVSVAPRDWHARLDRAGWTLRFLRRPWGLRRAFAVDLRNLLREVRPDIAHVHFHAGSLALVALLLEDRSRPRVMHWHSPPRATRFELRALDLWAGPRHIAVSESIATALCAPSGRVRVLPNGVVFPQAGPALVEGEDLLTVSALRPPKDPETLLRAIAILVAEGWKGRLRWAGSGPLLEGARREAERLGIGARVDFLGEVADPEPLYAGSVLLVHCSRREGQPYAVLEAIAHGRCVAASDLPGIRKILGEDSDILCARVGDPVALAGVIRELLGRPSLRRTVIDRLRVRAGERHSITTWVSTLLDWYDEWLAGPPGRSDARGS